MVDVQPPLDELINVTQPRSAPMANSWSTATMPRGFWATAASLRPGMNSVRAALVLLGLSLLYFLMPWTAILSAIAIGASGVLIAAIVETRVLFTSLRQLKVRRKLPVIVGRDVPFAIAWEIEHPGLSRQDGLLRDVMADAALPPFVAEPFHLDSSSTIASLTLSCRIPVRGQHSFGPIWIRLFGKLGLVEMQCEFDLPAFLRVLPEQFSSRDELLKDRGAELKLLDKIARSRQHGTGTEFESLTEFREGDDPRRIDWRATARIQRPVIRRFQIERHRDAMILLDSGRLMGTDAGKGTKLDCAVDAALILARVVLQSGDRCGLGVYDSELRGYLPPLAGNSALHPITNSVFDLQSNFRESDFAPMFATLQTRQAKRSLIVVLSDIAEVETSELFRASLARLSQRHVVLLAALRTPLLYGVLREPVDSMVDVAKKAVTFRLIRSRQLALQSLKHTGVYVIDVEPSQLTVPLVNQFIELRQRNLL